MNDKARVSPPLTSPPLTAERLFELFLWPLYPDDVRADLASARRTDANPGRNPSLVQALEETADRFAALAPTLFEGEDWRWTGPMPRSTA